MTAPSGDEGHTAGHFAIFEDNWSFQTGEIKSATKKQANIQVGTWRARRVNNDKILMSFEDKERADRLCQKLCSFKAESENRKRNAEIWLRHAVADACGKDVAKTESSHAA